MPTISAFYGILIRMFFNDHSPSHFHAIYSEHEAIINIEGLFISSGHLPRRALELVLDWAELHHTNCLKIGICARRNNNPKQLFL
jgi:hypothetical protein